MKIIRNGIEYKLTAAEMREVYNKMKTEYLIEDIQAKADEMEIEMSNEIIKRIANIVDKSLGNNDSYWESYWMTLECVLAENKIEV